MPSRSLLALACAALVLATGARAATATATTVAANANTFAPTFWETLCKEHYRFSILKEVVQCAGLVQLLSSRQTCGTFFAPDNLAWDDLLYSDLHISLAELKLPGNQGLLRELVKSLFVPHRQLRTPRDWPAWPHKRWVQTLVPKNKLGLAMTKDDGSKEDENDQFDAPGGDDGGDGGDDDGGNTIIDVFNIYGATGAAQIVPEKPYLTNLKVGSCGVMHTLEDIPTWLGWKAVVKKNVDAYRARTKKKP
ncbi:proteasome accessory factor 2 [Micractinium conductrix]|uniref:Proteasome accessory factor 2 n=1 Tax=Micractinium conductrix TaxID=554055 RepID=A0A2P6V100_9CHLO|nr:proteasome accessory factor 2 [Micractinium conductrix]|eukprot:PSC67777.1 proteasome accessory factor 2 [Micractinium conductrix]